MSIALSCAYHANVGYQQVRVIYTLLAEIITKQLPLCSKSTGICNEILVQAWN